MARRPLFGVDIDTRDLDRRLRRMPELIEQVADRVVGEEVRDVAADMRRLAPRRTGALIRGIQAEHRRGTAQGRAVARTRHSVFVERGTGRTRPQPYAAPAREISERRLPRRIAEAVEQELRRKS